MVINIDATTKEDKIRVEVGNDFKQPAADSNPNKELFFSTKVNLRESGLQHSPILIEKRQRDEAKSKADDNAYVSYGTRAKTKLLVLFTMISLVSQITLPHHQVPCGKTYTERLILQFYEVNEHYDNTVNQMHPLSYTTDISSNEVFTFRQAIKQDDRNDFITAMEN